MPEKEGDFGRQYFVRSGWSKDNKGGSTKVKKVIDPISEIVDCTVRRVLFHGKKTLSSIYHDRHEETAPVQASQPLMPKEELFRIGNIKNYEISSDNSKRGLKEKSYET